MVTSDLQSDLEAALEGRVAIAEIPMTDFVRRGVEAQLEPGAFVCIEGDRCRHLPLILQGVARVYAMAPNGREATLYRVKAGDTCVLTATCIHAQAPFPAFVCAETSVRALLLPPEAAGEWLDTYPVWRQYVFSAQTHRLQGLIGLLTEFSFGRMDRRLSALLLQESTTGDIVELTHAALATELGTSREVVSRLLKAFERAGLVALHRGSVELCDRAGLRGRARR